MSISLTEADKDHPITLSVNQTLDVRLRGNPTTGYQWRLAKTDTTLLPLVDSSYTQDTAQPGMVGIGGQYLFSFKAVAPGDVPLCLTFRRPWDQQEARIFTVNVSIKS